MSEYYRISEAAKLVKISPITLRKYTNEGRVSCSHNPAGQRVYTREQLAVLNPDLLTPTNRTWAYYLRASDGDPQLLTTQEKLLKANYPTPTTILTDKASGLNENRKGLQKLLSLAKKGTITDIAITEKDRLTRFGYTYLETLLHEYGVEIHVLGNTTPKTPHEELIQDFLSLLASFSGKYYRLRGHQQKKDFLHHVEEQL